MLRRSIWIMIALFLTITTAALARQQETPGPASVSLQPAWSADEKVLPAPLPAQRRKSYGYRRMSHSMVHFGVLAARGRRNFDGDDTYRSGMGAIVIGSQLSLLGFFFDNERRLRISDYIQGEIGFGWERQKRHNLPPEFEESPNSGSASIPLAYGFGVQGSYLISRDLELGMVVAKGQWNNRITFGVSDWIRDTGTPLIWTGRIRYGNLLGEIQTAATPKSDWHLGSFPNSGDKFKHHDTFLSFRLRYALAGKVEMFGADLELYNFHVEPDVSSHLYGRNTNQSAIALRIVIGAMN